MDRDYWLRQDAEPLFKNLLWSRPETKMTAGKLLIIGGHAQSFAAPAEAYTAAVAAGIGTVRVMLPASLEKTVGKIFPAAEFAPSNPSGGFAASALAELLAAAQWADGVLLAGDLGRNSETMAMLENFGSKYTGPLTITRDTGDFFCAQPGSLRSRPNTLLVITTDQLRRLGTSLNWSHAFSSSLGIVQTVELLHVLTGEYPNLLIITYQQGEYIAAVGGQVSTTPAPSDKPVWRVDRAAAAATWWLQVPDKSFEALTTSLL